MTTQRTKFESGPFIVAAVLLAAAALLGAIGAGIASRAALRWGTRYVQDMEPSASDLARMNWGRLQAAATAGTEAWRRTVQEADPSS